MYEEGKFEILVGLSLDNRASLEQQKAKVKFSTTKQ